MSFGFVEEARLQAEKEEQERLERERKRQEELERLELKVSSCTVWDMMPYNTALLFFFFNSKLQFEQ